MDQTEFVSLVTPLVLLVTPPALVSPATLDLFKMELTVSLNAHKVNSTTSANALVVSQLVESVTHSLTVCYVPQDSSHKDPALLNAL